MILVVCTDDANLRRVADNSAANHPHVFGAVYSVYTDQVPMLGVNETLFIIAHGAFRGDDGNAVIGDERNALYLNGVTFWENFKSRFPQNYDGRIYVDACESADRNAYTFGFTEVLSSQAQAGVSRVSVYGRNGAVGGMIPLPDDGSWVRA